MSSFTGIFPYFDPEYIIMVMIDEPKKITKGSIVTGGAIAAPVVKEVIKGLISLLDIQQKIKHYDNFNASNHKI
jgi:cell division protein FtsI (penicillin-binding protein 3)